mmetsp:Transcript_4537/g.13750  ORF Transcript_4537/g.13750 Transcript_4537/m.13750 type:complete len:220 (+) Transcript_4537:147-806(+)
MRKLRILCLHGYAQSAEGFRRKTGGTRGAVSKLVDFSYLNGPIALGNDDAAGYSWFQYNLGSEAFIASVKQALEHVDKFCRTEGPFDGIFAFSQGSCFAAVLSVLQDDFDTQNPCYHALKSLSRYARFKFMAVFAGFLPRDDAVKEMVLQSRPSLDTFHCFGESDEIITAQMSRDLANIYGNPQTYVHEGGHLVPSQAPVRKAFKSFIINQHEKLNSNS